MRELLWRLLRPDDICWRDWDGLGVVYDDGPGATHLVDALGIELLELLNQAPMSLRQLVGALDGALPDSIEASTASAIIEHQLDVMRNLRLIEPT